LPRIKEGSIEARSMRFYCSLSDMIGILKHKSVLHVTLKN